MSDTKVLVSAPPHIQSELGTKHIMWMVAAALTPAAVASLLFFGWWALGIIVISIFFALLTETLCELMMKRPLTISDGSAFVTGLLLALTLPPTVPWWIPALGSVFAIAVGKQVFGGLGHNLFNPALIGRAFLVLSWPLLMTTWQWPPSSLSWAGTQMDAVSGATALGLLKGGFFSNNSLSLPYLQMFYGNISGSLGETSGLALLLGAVFLLVYKIIDWRIPVTYLGTVLVLTTLRGQDPLFHLLAGGLILGAFFMATDYVTTPVTPGGRVLFGIGCGLLTALIRRFGAYPEGVCYSILIMNAITPLLDRLTVPKRFGEVKKDG
ncbi:MAG TPA: RnfABCDGE type electron transport complex subunit D [Bacillota bacterium]